MINKRVFIPIVIKKYSNRRLYNTRTSCYITLDDLCAIVKRGEEFVVKDSKSGKDLTHSVLIQIIFDKELQGYNVLPLSFLRQLICAYDASSAPLFSSFLESMMEHYDGSQKAIKSMPDISDWGDCFSAPVMKAAAEQNVAMLEKTMEFFDKFNNKKAS